MTKVLLDIMQISKKRMDVLKLLIFPTSLIYLSYILFPTYLINVSSAIPNFMLLDTIYIVLYNTLKLINIISWLGLGFILAISTIHYFIGKVINQANLFDEVLFLRHRTIQKLVYWLTESSGWYTILIAMLLIIHGPSALSTFNVNLASEFLLIFPTILFLIFYIGDWCITRKFGQDLPL